MAAATSSSSAGSDSGASGKPGGQENVSVLILQGPNLNLLGTREPEVYGHDTLDDIHERITESAAGLGATVRFLQSNAEHELVNALHAAPAAGTQFVIINPGAFTHTSVALRDAFLGVSLPFIEVHLSNVHAREAFRQTSYLSDIAVAVITGLGADGYLYALDAAVRRLRNVEKTDQNGSEDRG